MRTSILMLTALIVLITVPALAQEGQSLTDQVLSETVQKQVFGPGESSDVAGKTLPRQTQTPQVEPVNPDLPINIVPDIVPNIFGLGVNSAQYGKSAFDQSKQD